MKAAVSPSNTILGKPQAWYTCVISRIRTAVESAPAISGDVLSHLLWMLGRVDTFVSHGELEKANRWIGFVQGVLYSHGSSIDALREQITGCDS